MDYHIRRNGIERDHGIVVRTIAPFNCDKSITACELCGQTHLRPGYCQALHVPLDKSVPLSEESVPLSPDVPLTVPLKICGVCGMDFTPKRSTALYCSSACRKKAQR